MTRFIPTAGFPTQYGLSARELEANARCRREHRAKWAVLQRRGNASAFNGYRWQPSAYSAVKCSEPGCGRVWRTKAGYADDLPDAR